MALSFPPFPTRAFACIALVPLFRYIYRTSARAGDSQRDGGRVDHPLKRGFVVGYATGVVFFILSPRSNLAYIVNYTEDPPLKHA